MDSAIGLFDSGFGGLTVMKELIRLLPNENLIYLADTANLPYGEKSKKTLIDLAHKNARFLLSQNIKLLLIPCHTICCNALKSLQETLPIPVLGIIEPSLKLAKPFQKLAILGTSSMLRSNVYQTLLLEQNPKIDLSAQACPAFVPLVEQGLFETAGPIISQTLSSLPNDLEAALLACTHYPLIRSIIEKVLKVPLLDPAATYAEEAKQYLSSHSLLGNTSPTYRFYVSSSPNKFRTLAPLFLGRSIETVALNTLV